MGKAQKHFVGGGSCGKPKQPNVTQWLAALFTILCAILFVAVRVVLAGPTYAGAVTVTATMGSFSPNPVQAPDTASNNPGQSATSTLSASYQPPSGAPEGQLSPQYDWSVASVQYKALQADAWGAPPSNSYTDSINPTQPSGTPGATLTFTPLITGYWQVSVSCSVTVTDITSNQYWAGSADAGPEELTSYTFDITYTGPIAGQSSNDAGATVTNKTQNVHAGWPIQLGAVLSPSDLATKFTWTIQGAGGNGSAAINGYCSNQATGAPVVPGKRYYQKLWTG